MEKCYVTLEDIVIPKGTVLSDAPNSIQHVSLHFDCVIGFGPDYIASFIIDEDAMKAYPNVFEEEKK